jgi:hypothetical protein
MPRKQFKCYTGELGFRLPPVRHSDSDTVDTLLINVDDIDDDFEDIDDDFVPFDIPQSHPCTKIESRRLTTKLDSLLLRYEKRERELEEQERMRQRYLHYAYQYAASIKHVRKIWTLRGVPEHLILPILEKAHS